MPAVMHSLLPQDYPFTVDTIDYEFEEFATTRGIPEPMDPLPYRKPASIFSKKGEANGRYAVTTAKDDPRLRTVVCRHWLRGLCMKGSACEFLHQYDLSKMPSCRHGEGCRSKQYCPLKHDTSGSGYYSIKSKLECTFYTQGFCVHGPTCRYEHVREDPTELPHVANYTRGQIRQTHEARRR
jgi:cleavage and polyadenylation specificity factor subunit 4